MALQSFVKVVVISFQQTMKACAVGRPITHIYVFTCSASDHHIFKEFGSQNHIVIL